MKHSIAAANSKGAGFFKKLIEDKRAIHEQLQKGCKIDELKTSSMLFNPYTLQENNAYSFAFTGKTGKGCPFETAS